MGTRKASKRRRLLIGFALVVAVAIGSVLRRWPRERLLLQRATRVTYETNRDGWHSDNNWISDHKIVRIYIPGLVNATNMPLISICDLTSGNTQSYVVKSCPSSSHAMIQPSPDGRWALCYDTTDANGHVAATDLHTGHTLVWDNVGDLDCHRFLWMPDSFHWLSTATLPKGYLTLCDVREPGKSHRIAYSAAGTTRFEDYVVTTQNHLLVIKRTGAGAISLNGMDVTEYQLASVMKRLRTRRIRWPREGDVYQAEYSPSGDRIAWVIAEPHRSDSSLVWLHRWLPFIPFLPDLGQEVQSLWVSDGQGRHLHEIGHIVTVQNMARNLCFYDVCFPHGMIDVRWLPDSSKLCFRFHNALWTVPAD